MSEERESRENEGGSGENEVESERRSSEERERRSEEIESRDYEVVESRENEELYSVEASDENIQLNDEAKVAEELSDKQMEEVGMRNECLEQMNESEEITGGYIAMPAQDFIRGNLDTDNTGENYE